MHRIWHPFGSTYDLLVDVLMLHDRQRPSRGFAAEALVVSERGRARSLIDLLAEARADIRQGVDQALLARERSLEQQLNAVAERQARLLSGTHTRAEAVALDKELAALTAAYDEVQNQIKAKGPRYAALTQVQALSIADVQKLLDDRTVAPRYALGDERSYVWAVTRTSLTSHELPKRADVERAAGLADVPDLRARQRRPGESEEDYGVRVREADAEYWRHAAALSEMALGAGRWPTWRQAIVRRGRRSAAVHPLCCIARTDRAGRQTSHCPRASCSPHSRS